MNTRARISAINISILEEEANNQHTHPDERNTAVRQYFQKSKILSGKNIKCSAY